MANSSYVALDLELVDDNSRAARVIELAAVRFREDRVLEEWATLVNPGVPLPYAIRVLTGIGDEQLRAAPTLDQIAGQLRAFLGTDPIVGQSVELDLDALGQAGVSLSNPTLDTFELATMLLPGLKAYDLRAIACALGIPGEHPHRALPDAHLARQVFLKLIERLRGLDVEILAHINRVTSGLPWPYRPLFVDAEQEKRRRLVQDALAGRPIDPLSFGLGRLLTVKEDAPEPLIPHARTRRIDVEGLVREMRPGGRVASSLPAFEERPEQIEMLRAVGDALNHQRHLVVEAGTGTGKSLAYLVPMLAFAAANNRRVVISTNTINLQDQLFEKDIPGVVRALEYAVRTAVLKGRTNYLCLQRWLALLREEHHTLPEATLLVKTLLWVGETRTGDRSELRLTPEEEIAWNRICSQAESCSPVTCPYHRAGVCFIARARRAAEASHVVVVNHALLLSDLATSNRVLPDYDHLVVDEAHHFEEEATEQLGFTISASAFLEPMAALCPGAGPGGLDAAIAVLHSSGISPERRAELAARAARARSLTGQAGQDLDDFFMALRELIQSRVSGPQPDVPVRLTKTVRQDGLWQAAELRWANARRALEDLRAEAAPILEELAQIADGADPGQRSASARRTGPGTADAGEVRELLRAPGGAAAELYAQLVAAHLRIAESVARMDAIVSSMSSDSVCWVSLHGNGTSHSLLLSGPPPTLHLAPLDVAPHIRKWLLDEKATVIFTSATLTTAGSFDYIRRRLGATDAVELALGSPFDYQRVALVFLPTDVPEPNQPGYVRKCADTIADVAEALGGRTLALFTSHAQLRSTYEMIRERMDRAQLVLMGQGIDGSRSRLIERFKMTPRALLLGTASFWEGVDVVGDALSALIIARLPFAVPTDPIFAARSEEFDDPFGEYAVPQAVLRFKQGFGRLIRSQTDRGVAIVLDRRILTKRYGTAFLNSLPPCTVHRAPAAVAGMVARDWIEGSKSAAVQTREAGQRASASRGRRSPPLEVPTG